VADEAHAEWDDVLDRYQARLRKIRPLLPPSVRQLCDGLRLHDATLVFLCQREPTEGAPGGGACHLALRLEPPRKELVLLAYQLVDEPFIETGVLPAEVRSSEPLFLYDEIDARRREGEVSFTHSILFGNGLHLRLGFRDVTVTVEEQLLPVPEPPGAAVPRSA
jgi:hypothetical protein